MQALYGLHKDIGSQMKAQWIILDHLIMKLASNISNQSSKP